MNFLAMPPELNSGLMYSGPGSGSLLQAAAAWDGLATELGASASSFSSVTSELTNQAWQGPAAQAMTVAAAPYAGWLNAASERAAGTALQARTVANLFEATQAAMVHPAAVAANRNGLVQLVMSNLFGQNAPAIAAVESEYEQMWARDVAAMVGYHSGASQAAAALAAATSADFGTELLGLLGKIGFKALIAVAKKAARAAAEQAARAIKDAQLASQASQAEREALAVLKEAEPKIRDLQSLEQRTKDAEKAIEDAEQAYLRQAERAALQQADQAQREAQLVVDQARIDYFRQHKTLI